MSIHGDHPQESSGDKEFPDFAVLYGDGNTVETENFDGDTYKWEVSEGVLAIIRAADDEPVEAFAPGFWQHVGEIRRPASE